MIERSTWTHVCVFDTHEGRLCRAYIERIEPSNDPRMARRSCWPQSIKRTCSNPCINECAYAPLCPVIWLQKSSSAASVQSIYDDTDSESPTRTNMKLHFRILSISAVLEKFLNKFFAKYE